MSLSPFLGEEMPDSIFDLKEKLAKAKAKLKSLKGSDDPLAINAAQFEVNQAQYLLDVAERHLKGKK
jgi:hypothetical protein